MHSHHVPDFNASIGLYTTYRIWVSWPFYGFRVCASDMHNEVHTIRASEDDDDAAAAAPHGQQCI
jgi:hypothetical protein